jgi:type I restriction enzyme S subunit
LIVKLPNGWIKVKLGDICHTTSGGTPSRKNMEYYNGNIPWVKSGELNYNIIRETEEKVTKEAIINSSAKIFPKGTLLIALYGATIGKIAILGVDAATNQAVCGIFENERIITKYLYWYLLYYKPEFIKIGFGGAQPNISQTIVKDLDIPLPTISIQKQIVDKIEELFSELDYGVEYLIKVKEQLKVYRQAVLSSAFSGKLSNHNLNTNEYPVNWSLIRISDICDVVRGGSPRPAGSPKYYGGTIPFLKVRDLTKDNNIYLYNYEYTIKEAGLKKTRMINPNTLLLTNSGATLGVPKICMIEATMNDGVAAFINLDTRSIKYLYYFWVSKTKELRNINQGAAQPNLNTIIIKNYEIPYCSFEEQQIIVDEIETRLSVCDKIEETIKTSLIQSESLRQSILKKAFEGNLI